MRHNRPILRLMVAADLHVVRLMLGIAELIWAATLLWPGGTFGRIEYSAMAQVMSENEWGVLFLFTGLTQLAILKWGDYWDLGPISFSAYNCVLWNFVVLGHFLSVWPPPAAISGEIVLAAFSTWLFVRAGARVSARDSRFAVKQRGGDHGLVGH